MCPYKKVYVSCLELVQQKLPRLSMDLTVQKCHIDSGVLEEICRNLRMLAGKKLRRRHERYLSSVTDGMKCGDPGHKCLSGTHISLQKSVHALCSAHIFSDLIQNLDLIICEGKRKTLYEFCLCRINPVLYRLSLALNRRPPLSLKLQIEDFPESQSPSGLFQGLVG